MIPTKAETLRPDPVFLDPEAVFASPVSAVDVLVAAGAPIPARGEEDVVAAGIAAIGQSLCLHQRRAKDPKRTACRLRRHSVRIRRVPSTGAVILVDLGRARNVQIIPLAARRRTI